MNRSDCAHKAGWRKAGDPPAWVESSFPGEELFGNIAGKRDSLAGRKLVPSSRGCLALPKRILRALSFRGLAPRTVCAMRPVSLSHFLVLTPGSYGNLPVLQNDPSTLKLPWVFPGQIAPSFPKLLLMSLLHLWVYYNDKLTCSSLSLETESLLRPDSVIFYHLRELAPKSARCLAHLLYMMATETYSRKMSFKLF